MSFNASESGKKKPENVACLVNVLQVRNIYVHTHTHTDQTNFNWPVKVRVCFQNIEEKLKRLKSFCNLNHICCSQSKPENVNTVTWIT